MRFAHPDNVVAVTSAAGAAKQGLAALDQRGYAVFRIGRLREGGQDSRRLAEQIMAALRDELVSAGAPTSLGVEVDEPQTTIMPSSAPVRNMLPHHDGQHSSYLTPSTELVPEWRPESRTFSAAGFTTTNSHKLYQGIFIAEPGEGLSVTTHLNLVGVVRDAANRRGITGLAEVAAWYGQNLSAALRERAINGSNYPTLAGMLGLDQPWLHATPLIREEADLPTGSIDRHPELAPLLESCPCGRCGGETLRIFCHVVDQALGLHAASFFERYRTCLVAEQYDLLVTHNIASMHGGLLGGRSRVLDPIYLSLAQPEGPEYERWLTRSWESAFRVAT